MTLPEEYAWEQLPEESPKAFKAFELYLGMGLERSISKVAAKLEKSCTIIGRWSGQWQWVERIRRYDAWKQQVKRAKLREKIEKSAEEDFETAKTLQNILVAPAVALQEKMQIYLNAEKGMAEFFEGMTNPALLDATVSASRVIPQLQQAKREALGVLERIDEQKNEEHDQSPAELANAFASAMVQTTGQGALPSREDGVAEQHKEA